MKTNYLKVGVLGLMMMAGAAVNAQTTDATEATLIKNAGDGVSVRVIDNKGTIKYLQTNNGITSITSTTAGNSTTTTWQLGGELTDNTYIDAGGAIFSLDGIQLVDPSTAAATDIAATSSVTRSGHVAGTTTTLSTDTGWTVVIRDEATGEFKKILASDLVSTGHAEVTLAADGDLDIPATGLASATPLSKVSVYRNGAKLRSGATTTTPDYTITADDVITLAPVAATATSTDDWSTLAGDVIEVHWMN